MLSYLCAWEVLDLKIFILVFLAWSTHLCLMVLAFGSSNTWMPLNFPFYPLWFSSLLGVRIINSILFNLIQTFKSPLQTFLTCISLLFNGCIIMLLTCWLLISLACPSNISLNTNSHEKLLSEIWNSLDFLRVLML